MGKTLAPRARANNSSTRSKANGREGEGLCLAPATRPGQHRPPSRPIAPCTRRSQAFLPAGRSIKPDSLSTRTPPPPARTSGRGVLQLADAQAKQRGAPPFRVRAPFPDRARPSPPSLLPVGLSASSSCTARKSRSEPALSSNRRRARSMQLAFSPPPPSLLPSPSAGARRPPPPASPHRQPAMASSSLGPAVRLDGPSSSSYPAAAESSKECVHLSPSRRSAPARWGRRTSISLKRAREHTRRSSGPSAAGNLLWHHHFVPSNAASQRRRRPSGPVLWNRLATKGTTIVCREILRGRVASGSRRLA